MKDYSIKQLKSIYSLIDQENLTLARVRGYLLELFDGNVPKEFVFRTPAFCHFVEQNSELIGKALMSEKRITFQHVKKNRELLQDQFLELDARSEFTGLPENKLLRFKVLYSPFPKNELRSYGWIKNFIRTICTDFDIKTHNINKEIAEGFDEYGFDTDDSSAYRLIFIISSNHELTGLIGRNYADTLEFIGADFMLTNDSTLMIKILEKY